MDTNVTNVHKAAEIFTTLGDALSKVSDLIMQLNPQVEAPPGSKWTEEEILLLRKAVDKFGHDIPKISDIVKTRSATQLKNALKRRIYANETTPGPPLPPSRSSHHHSNQYSGRTPAKKTKFEPTVETLTTETVPFDDEFQQSLDNQTSAVGKVVEPIKISINRQHQASAETLGAATSSSVNTSGFISSHHHHRSLGGVSELDVNNVPNMPPLDL